VFNELVETSDRVIVDSAMLPDPEDGLVKLAALIHERSPWAAFSDLNWSRLTPWRVSISGFFDVPDWRPYLARINRVEIDYEQAPTAHRSISSQVLLIVGWLAGRLKWRPTSKLQWTGHEYRLELAAKNRAIFVQIRTSPPKPQGTDPLPLPSLHTLRLLAEEEPAAEFIVSGSKGDPSGRSYLQTSVKLAGTHLTGDITGLNLGSEAKLINTELEILTPDTVYAQALAMAAKITTNVRCPLSLAHCPLY